MLNFQTNGKALIVLSRRKHYQNVNRGGSGILIGGGGGGGQKIMCHGSSMVLDALSCNLSLILSILIQNEL